MLSENLLKELNEQITYEFYSSHLYLSMAAYCYAQDLDGFANFFIVQAEEEKFHAMKFFNFINDMDGKITMQGLDNPTESYSAILEVFEKSYKHEKFVTSRIYKLMDIAMADHEHATVSFLKWFIDEQIEEENTFKTLIQKLKRAGSDQNMIYMLDTEAFQRVFTPPAQA